MIETGLKRRIFKSLRLHIKLVYTATESNDCVSAECQRPDHKGMVGRLGRPGIIWETQGRTMAFSGRFCCICAVRFCDSISDGIRTVANDETAD